jgi:hypothetical protein
MQAFRSPLDQINWKIPLIEDAKPELIVGLATIPCLGLILCGRTLSHWVTQLGVASEEVFRGERLPVLSQPLED